MQNASCSIPVRASAPLSAGPSVRSRTSRITGRASGSASHGSNSHAVSPSPPSSHGSGAVTNAPSTIRTYSPRARARPSRTADVFLPARRSVSRSRTLLTTRIAEASSPTGTASTNASHARCSVCAKYEPATATTPKNRNTNTSPRPS